ncbi:MAG: glycoside hydrolase family 3 N-terminal domain-containing protein [Chloroflexota bacterium]
MTMVYADANRSITERVDDLIERMTLDEKLAQLGSFWIYEVLDGTVFSSSRAQDKMSHGIGQVTRLGGASNVRPQEAAVIANQIQKWLQDNTRLRIPAVIHEECCSGYMAFGATVFPQAIGVASTWEPELVEEMTGIIRRQMRSVGAHHALAPVLDITRDARWGRVEETFGEDPYLTATMGVAYVHGLQADSLQEGVVATAKHLVGYGASEGGLNWAPAHIPARELHEVYLLPFEAAVKTAGLGSVMNGYHELDGVPCGASEQLLTHILRDEWGFDGTVVSDYFAIEQLRQHHRLTDDKGRAAHIALNAGIDVELPATDCYGDPLRHAVESANLREDLVDIALRRVLRQKMALGLFEKPYVDVDAVEFDTRQDRAIARKLAQKSLVLLKNNGILPLSGDTRTVAVIGPNADSTRNLFGDYAYPAHIETLIEMTQQADDTNVFDMPIPDKVTDVDDFIEAVSVRAAIEQVLDKEGQIRYARGCDVNSDDRSGFVQAVQAASGADVAVLVVGDKAGLTDECTSGEARDRAQLGLPGVQADLVRAVHETGTPVIMVLVNGRPVTLEWMARDIPAILEAWFPAEEGAHAIADALFGEVNPGGKLPISFPRTVGQVPVFYSHKPSGGRSHWKENYVEESTRPLYPFGHGLSYTTFEYAGLEVTPTTARGGESITVKVEITNTGNVAGDEVVQLYTQTHGASVTRPVKELRGYKRVTLELDQSIVVMFEFPVNMLAYYNQQMQYVVEPGTVDVLIGSSSEDIRLKHSFGLVGPIAEVKQKVFFSTVS